MLAIQPIVKNVYKNAQQDVQLVFKIMGKISKIYYELEKKI